MIWPVPDDSTAVIIVGAGPAGLVVAHLLQREGIAFTLLERHPQAELRAVPKAGAIEHRTVQLLTREGIAPTVLDFTVENHCCEFRTPLERVVFDYGAITGGRPHYVYPQHELVARLCEPLAAAGADLRFGQAVVSVEERDDAVGVTIIGADGVTSTIDGQVVVGCDGVRSVVSEAFSDVEAYEQTMPVRWLAVIGQAPPLMPHTIYAAHPRGFGGQMRRGPNQTRWYLEVPVSDGLDAWPEDRIRDELCLRLGVPGELDGVAFVEPTLVDLRMRMLTSMQRGRIFLAGDAAHLITPAGGKGMNLAIQDAVELAHGLAERFGPEGDGSRLAAYSATRLPTIWRTQAFSSWMLRLILAGSDRSGDEAGARFGRGLREGWVSSLQRDPLLARWFAHAYAGVDLDEADATALVSAQPIGG
jgi:p-hydroxybenzoate 3-monooxygenase